MRIPYSKQKYLLLKNIEDDLLKVLKTDKARIAGGAVRAVFANEYIADFDIYPRSDTSFALIKDFLDKNYTFKFKSENAFSYEKNNQKYQLIRKYCDLDNESLLNKFDFTICMGLYDFELLNFYLKEEFLPDVSRKELVFNPLAEYPIASLYRIKKYMKRGYSISGTEIIKIGLSIHNLKLENYRDLKNQLMGIDTLFLKELTDLMMTPEYADKKYDYEQFLNLLEENMVEDIEKVLE